MPQRRISTRMKKKQIDNKPLYISARVQEVREQLGITLKELGALLGVTAPAVGQAERNNTGLLFEIIILFANKYQVNPAWIITENNKGIPQIIDRPGAGKPIEFIPDEVLDATALATRIRRDVLKLKELVEEETLRKSKTTRGKGK